MAVDVPADPQSLRALAEQGRLSPQALERALRLGLEPPSLADWTRLSERLLLVLGTALALAGVVFFFAYNWSGLGRFARFGLIQAGILAAALTALRLGLDGLPGRLALLAAAVLIGPLLGVYGQAYQTGADPYELFLTWLGLALPWALAARFAPLWLGLVVLANVSLGLYWEQAAPDAGGGLPVYLALFALNAGAWLAAEVLAPPLRWLSRLLALAALAVLTVPACGVVLDWMEDGWGLATLSLLAATGVAVLTVYRRARPDLFMLALVTGAGMAVVSCLAGRIFFQVLRLEEMGALALALVLLAQLGAAAAGLRRLGREMKP